MAGITGIEAMICLAQIQNVDPAFLRDWLLVAFGFLMVIAVILTLWLRAKPQRRDVRMLDQSITSDQCARMQKPVEERVDRIERDLAHLRTELKRDREAMDKNHEERVKRIHERIDRMQAELSSMPARVVAELVNSKQLWMGK